MALYAGYVYFILGDLVIAFQRIPLSSFFGMVDRRIEYISMIPHRHKEGLLS